MNCNNEKNFSNIINKPIIINKDNNNYIVLTILQLICANQLGLVMEFMISLMNSYDIFNIQDDDGNTPLHLLCKNINDLDNVNINFIDFFQNHSDHYECFSDFSSRPILSKSLSVIEHLSNNVKFSIKNKEGKTPDELTTNILVHNYYCQQLYNINKKNFPLKSSNTNNDFLYEKFEQSLEKDWRDLFTLKDSKRNNKTLMHFLCEGDRLNAVQFLVEHGADINYILKAEDIKHIKREYDLTNMTFYIFRHKYINYSWTVDAFMNVKGKTPLSFLFSSYESNYYPSGYYYQSKFDKINNLRGFADSFINNQLNKNEKYILKETEEIVEYLINQGTNIMLEKELNLSILSDYIYKVLKKKNKKESDSSTTIDTNDILSEKTSEQKNKPVCRSQETVDNNKYNQENKEKSSTSVNKEETLSQNNCNKNELEKSTNSNDDLQDNTKQTNTSVLLTTEEHNKSSHESKNYNLVRNNEGISQTQLDNTNPVRANLNFPVSLWEDLREFSILSGKSVDTVCWELLSSVLKDKLKHARGFDNDNTKKE